MVLMDMPKEASGGCTGQTGPCTTRGERSPQRDYEDRIIQGSASQSIEKYVFKRSTLVGRSPSKTSTDEKEETSESVSEESEISKSVSEMNTTIIEIEGDEDEGNLENSTPRNMRTWSFESIAKSERGSRDDGIEKEERERQKQEEERKEKIEQGQKMKHEVTKLSQLIKVFRGNIENNTKKELKRAVNVLERIGAEFEKPKMKKWLEESAIEPKNDEEKKIEARNREGKENVKRIEKDVATQGTQTESISEEQLNEECLDDELLKKVSTYEEWNEVKEWKWEERCYKKTKIVRLNPAWQKPEENRIKVVIVENGDEQMEKGVQYLYKRK
nr:transcriptional regulator ATRX-like [Onthophagus taurus]